MLKKDRVSLVGCGGIFQNLEERCMKSYSQNIGVYLRCSPYENMGHVFMNKSCLVFKYR